MLGLIGLLGLAVASVFMEISPTDSGHPHGEEPDGSDQPQNDHAEAQDPGALTTNAGIPGIEDFLQLQTATTDGATTAGTGAQGGGAQGGAQDGAASTVDAPLDPAAPAVGGGTATTGGLSPLDPATPAQPPAGGGGGEDGGTGGVDSPLDPSLPAVPQPDPGATGPADPPLDPAIPAMPQQDPAAMGPADSPLDPAAPAVTFGGGGASSGVLSPLPPTAPQVVSAAPAGSALWGNDPSTGGTGADTMTGDDGASPGLGGHDGVTYGTGPDSLADGRADGAGNDTLGDGTLTDGPGHDPQVGPGADAPAAPGAGLDAGRGGMGNDTLHGTAGIDPATGAPVHDGHHTDHAATPGRAPHHDPQAPVQPASHQAPGTSGSEGSHDGSAPQDDAATGHDTASNATDLSGDDPQGDSDQQADGGKADDWLATGASATIHDFDPARDRIEVQYDPATHPDPHLAIEPGSRPGAVVVTLDGEHLVQVLNAGALSPASVDLVRMAG